MEPTARSHNAILFLMSEVLSIVELISGTIHPNFISMKRTA